MSILLHGDCLEEMKSLDDKSIDLIFCDLPYGQTSCKWDCKIDLEKFWIEIMRIKKLNTPIFMTTTTKFGVELINSAPKKCPFRYDLVWVKSAPAGFLSAKKMPMRKHEMVYVFYEKLPYYDLSSHKHKFIKEEIKYDEEHNSELYGDIKRNDFKDRKKSESRYDPPLPVSVVKEVNYQNTTYGSLNIPEIKDRKNGESRYDPPLPVSVVKEEKTQISKSKDKDLYGGMNGGTIGNVHGTNYDPPLPVSVVKEELCKYDVNKNTYGGGKDGRIKISKNKEDHQQRYDPPLPVSVLKEKEDVYDAKERFKNGKLTKHPRHLQKGDDPIYDPPLPTTMLDIKSTRGKHSTEKPVALMEWILKYFSKDGDTVLDPTMGSGSTGVACKNMNRNFIGIEMNDEIYEVAVNRIS
jgi:hypothetical protein